MIRATISCGQREAPGDENGQSPARRPSEPCVIEAKLKRTIVINDVRISAVISFLWLNFTTKRLIKIQPRAYLL